MTVRARVLTGLVGVAGGALMTLAAVGVVRAVGEANEPSQPSTVSSACAGAEFAVTLRRAPGSSLVLVDVVIHDEPPYRRWQVKWAGHHGPPERISPELHSDIAHVFRPLGDLDDGPERRVWIRPDGQRAWCKAVARLG
jgi:hypothetical protein